MNDAAFNLHEMPGLKGGGPITKGGRIIIRDREIDGPPNEELRYNEPFSTSY